MYCHTFGGRQTVYVQSPHRLMAAAAVVSHTEVDFSQ